MTTRQKCESLARKTGCEFKVDREWVHLTAPKGYAFCDSSVAHHYADFCCERGGYSTKAESYSDCYSAMKSGLVECDCDVCR